MAIPAAVNELRHALEQRFPDTLPLGRGLGAGVRTGLAALDALLPGRGLPRTRLTAWQPGGGATAILRSACEAVAGSGERAAWVEAGGVQGSDFWRGGPLLLRPGTGVEALAAAEELLRSGGFALVVLNGAGRDAAREAVRLTRAARAGGAAFVAVMSDAAVAHLRVRSRIHPDGYRWRLDPFGEAVEVVGVRLAPEPRLVDRRGAPPAVRWRRSRRGAPAG